MDFLWNFPYVLWIYKCYLIKKLSPASWLEIILSYSESNQRNTAWIYFDYTPLWLHNKNAPQWNFHQSFHNFKIRSFKRRLVLVSIYSQPTTQRQKKECFCTDLPSCTERPWTHAPQDWLSRSQHPLWSCLGSPHHWPTTSILV